MCRFLIVYTTVAVLGVLISSTDGWGRIRAPRFRIPPIRIRIPTNPKTPAPVTQAPTTKAPITTQPPTQPPTTTQPPTQPPMQPPTTSAPVAVAPTTIDPELIDECENA